MALERKHEIVCERKSKRGEDVLSSSSPISTCTALSILPQTITKTDFSMSEMITLIQGIYIGDVG
jgi:hypothetical protein